MGPLERIAGDLTATWPQSESGLPGMAGAPAAPGLRAKPQGAIFSAVITQSRRIDRISIAAPGDFAHAGWAPLAALPDGALPYCLDVLSRRSLYVTGLDRRQAQQAPFYFLYARRHAREIISVPWERDTPRPGAAAPLFLFSPGRCGSTLLSQILSDAGVPNVSEPDFYTQLTTALGTAPLNPLRAAMRRAAGSMGSALTASFGAPLVVKLRAESCRAPGLLLQGREKRALFMTRDFEDWARSTAQAFRNSPRKMVAKYMRALACYDWLRRHGEVLPLRYEELVAAPEDAAASLSRFLGRPVTPAAARAALARDSQAGTPLARGCRLAKGELERPVEEAVALWNSDRLKRARARLDLAGLGMP